MANVVTAAAHRQGEDQELLRVPDLRFRLLLEVPSAAEWSRTVTGVSTHKALNLGVGGDFSSIQCSQVT
jgi:hypothetical protein